MAQTREALMARKRDNKAAGRRRPATEEPPGREDRERREANDEGAPERFGDERRIARDVTDEDLEENDRGPHGEDRSAAPTRGPGATASSERDARGGAV
jgi:hypothetical protein